MYGNDGVRKIEILRPTLILVVNIVTTIFLSRDSKCVSISDVDMEDDQNRYYISDKG